MAKTIPTFEEYLSGAFLANVPFWLYLYVYQLFISSLNINSFLFTIIIPLLMVLLGSIISSYLVAGRTVYNYLKVGIKIGLGGFIINFIMNLIIFQSSVLLETFIGFIVGGLLGGALREQYKPSRKKTS